MIASNQPRATLIVLLGPTSVGKTELSLSLARTLTAPIISADSRQIYREIPIGTAAISLEDRGAVPHYFVGSRSIHEPYSAQAFEQDVLGLLGTLWAEMPGYAILTGGSMMYLDAVCRGIDDIPDVSPSVRQEVYDRYASEGLVPLLAELQELDPEHYERVDRNNYKRVLHALEVCLTTGKPFSSFHTGAIVQRPFNIIKIGLTRDREELCERINKRVHLMIEAGLIEEARAVYPYRELNALNTVGYKELFSYFDGLISLEEAIRQIQRNTRIYARKQMTWWRRDRDIAWFHPEDTHAIFAYLDVKFGIKHLC